MSQDSSLDLKPERMETAVVDAAVSPLWGAGKPIRLMGNRFLLLRNHDLYLTLILGNGTRGSCTLLCEFDFIWGIFKEAIGDSGKFLPSLRIDLRYYTY